MIPTLSKENKNKSPLNCLCIGGGTVPGEMALFQYYYYYRPQRNPTVNTSAELLQHENVPSLDSSIVE